MELNINNIEREIGISIDILYKANSYGIWGAVHNGVDIYGKEIIIAYKECARPYIDFLGKKLNVNGLRDYYFEDYGKTWALNQDDFKTEEGLWIKNEN